jgi:hypothetical protein
MTSKSKLIRTIYLYAAALISLIFLAVGTGRLLNGALKYYIFPKAEKGGYSRCNQPLPIFNAADLKSSPDINTEQKAQIDQMLKDYEIWKKDNIGDECYSAERQNNTVDALTLIIIALPICLLHWKMIRKEKEDKENNA